MKSTKVHYPFNILSHSKRSGTKRKYYGTVELISLERTKYTLRFLYVNNKIVFCASVPAIRGLRKS
jgi:hypothetical protein